MNKKSSAKKKPNRKLRRVVRRTFAGILMVSAIAVAAIPAGKIQAGTSVTTNTNTYIEDDGRTAPIPYEYNATTNVNGVHDDRKQEDAEGKKAGDAAKAATNGFKNWGTERDSSWTEASTKPMYTAINDASLADYHNGTITETDKKNDKYVINRAYSTRTDSDGKTYMGWQFEFANNTVYKYNSKFKMSNVTLAYQTNTWYLQVPVNAFNKFFTDNSDSYTLTYDQWSKDSKTDPIKIDGLFIKRYFNDAYNTFVALCEAYATKKQEYDDAVTAHDIWDHLTDEQKAKTSEPTIPPEPSVPEDITYTPKQITDQDMRMKYYCDADIESAGKVAGKVLKMKLTGSNDSDLSDASFGNISTYGNDLSLVFAKDEEDYSNIKDVYLVKASDTTKLAGGATKDDYGYVVSSHSSQAITAIGDYAFANVQGIDNLTLPDEITNIGDYAFQSSFIKNITLSNVACIGNGAFKDCTQLSTVDFDSNVVEKIGAEAFENTGLTSFAPTYALKYIGVGAFANCKSLSSVDLSKVTSKLTIDRWSFYGDSALASFTFPQKEVVKDIGEYAFAVPMNGTNAALSITLPVNISTINDYLVSGRSNLVSLTFPQSSQIKIPQNMFYGCNNLSYVLFPDGCREADYNAGHDRDNPNKGVGVHDSNNKDVNPLFIDVINSEFYVEGPAYISGSAVALERQDTWYARTMVNDYVPYVYTYGGVKYYEISDGTYRLTADEQGELVSCVPVDEKATTDIDLVIPKKVGKYTITSIKAGCFSNEKIKNRLHSITIPDGTISTIPSNCFEDLPNLVWVKIGNSVTGIGASAFEGCTSLVDVTFSSLGDNYASLTIGTDAFTTEGTKLVVHGDIKPGYAPFDWAMNSENYVSKTDSIRVCYVSLDPTDLMVMLDNETGLSTLVDYPHWNELDIDHYEYDRDMETYYYGIYGTTDYDQKRAEFYADYLANGDTAYGNDTYGPWVTPKFSASPNAEGSIAEADVEVGHDTLLAWMQPIQARAAGNPDAYFAHTGNAYSIIKNLENTEEEPKAWQTATTSEIALGKGCTDITIPDGVQSIDTKAFYGGASNKKDYSTYLNKCVPVIYNQNYESTFPTNKYLVSEAENNMYFKDVTGHTTESTTKTIDGTAMTYEYDVTPGLFSGIYDDGAVINDGVYDDKKESDEHANVRGNDRLTSITMSSVTSLPNYAFDSCNNLTSATLGSACTTVGTAPFRCDAILANVVGNDSIIANNGIIYDSVSNGDGTLKIVECLAGRGSAVGSSYVGDATDATETADLAKTTTIEPGAFEGCNSVKNIDISTTTVKTIPEGCFRNCESLTGKVILPSTASSIKSEAFKNDKKVNITIPASEVFIATDAITHGPNAKKEAQDGLVTIRTYPNSAAAEYADYYDIECDTTLGKLWNVSFRDSDGSQIGTTIQVENGTVLSNEQKPANPTKTGYTFTKWISSSGVEIDGKIVADTTFFASYKAESGTHDGKYYVYFYDGVTGTQISKVEVEPGAAATAPTAPTHSGYTFSSWSADFSKVTSDLSVIALYASNGGSSTSTSANNNNSGTKNSSTSSSNGSSSSSSSSTSTSTSTSTSGATYTVTVVNGSGGGSFKQGTTVAVVAAAAPSGKAFSMWTVDPPAVVLVNAAMSATTFTMPASNVTVTAVYVDAAAATTAAGTSAKSSGSSTSVSANNSSNGGASTTNGGNNAQVVIDNVPEISNQDVATALVHGSSDEYVIKITKSDDATKAVESALKNRYGSLENLGYDAMDISLYDSTGTKKITDTKNISVDITIPLPDELRSYGGNNLAGAVANNTLESLAPKFTTINSVPCITFTATHFSPYTIYVDKSNLDASEMLDATPKTGDPLNPKWFLAIGMACLSVILFLKKDSMQTPELVGLMNGNASREDSSREYSRYSGSMRTGSTRDAHNRTGNTRDGNMRTGSTYDGNMRTGNTRDGNMREERKRVDGKVESSYDRYVRENFRDDDKKK